VRRFTRLDFRFSAGDGHEGLFERSDIIQLVERQVPNGPNHSCRLGEEVDSGVLSTVGIRHVANFQFQRHVMRRLCFPISKAIGDSASLLGRTESKDTTVELDRNTLVERRGR
jgi:hypothetical protein